VLLLTYWTNLLLRLLKVEGQGFKVDAARLAQLSEVIDGMLYVDDGKLGLKKEGTEDFPIIVEGCTAETFANFLGWLNHQYVYDISLII
jgi:hypothetical protein